MSAREAAKAAQGRDGAEFVAGMALELLTGCEEPDTAVEVLLKALVQSKELSKGTVRALQCALVSLAGAGKTPAANTPAPGKANVA